ncbi:MAG: orotidine-5'-phosphate decarboxylase [Chitinivibrionales bacterium]
MGFNQMLADAVARNHSLVCVGLDPDLTRIPAHLLRQPRPIFRFNKTIIDATVGFVCAYKPQIAYYAAAAAEEQLSMTIDYIHTNFPHIPVILDAKRNDIGSTAAQYAREAFERYGADAVTVTPYLGGDTLRAFLDYEDKGVIVLCRTSNPGAGDLQDLNVDGQPLFETVARKAAGPWNYNKNICLVVGATWPEQLKKIRSIVGDMNLLVPGIGAQGGDVEAVMQNGLTAQKMGLIINSSRSILYAGDGEDFAQAARAATQKLRDQINAFRHR